MGKLFKDYNWLSWLLVALIALIVLASCTNQRKATRWFNEHPQAAAEYCGDKFPPRDSVGKPVIDSTRRASNVDYTNAIDSLTRALDELNQSFAAVVDSTSEEVAVAYRAELHKLQQRLIELSGRVTEVKKVYVPCAPDTVFITKPIYRANTAKEEWFKIELAKLQAKFDEVEQARKKWRTRAIWTWSILAIIAALAVAYKLFKAKLPIKVG